MTRSTPWTESSRTSVWKLSTSSRFTRNWKVARRRRWVGAGRAMRGRRFARVERGMWGGRQCEGASENANSARVSNPPQDGILPHPDGKWSIFTPYTYEGEVVRLVGAIVICVFFAAGLTAAPNIAGVYNAASWVVAHQTNSAIAKGAIFTVTGTGLGPTTIQHANSYPLPTTEGLAGTTIQVTVNGVTKNCIMVYRLVT